MLVLFFFTKNAHIRLLKQKSVQLTNLENEDSGKWTSH